MQRPEQHSNFGIWTNPKEGPRSSRYLESPANKLRGYTVTSLGSKLPILERDLLAGGGGRVAARAKNESIKFVAAPVCFDVSVLAKLEHDGLCVGSSTPPA